MNFNSSEELAKKLDEEDPLKTYRQKFHIPKSKEGVEVAYFTGNSLGLQPKSSRAHIEYEMKGWETLGVEGHFHTNRRPWFSYHQYSKKALSSIIGAKEIEVVAMNNLTSNLHFMMVSFYRPKGIKYKILMEEGAFPSDQYAVESQVKFHGYDPKEAIIEVSPRKGAYLLRTEDILKAIQDNAEEIALVLFGGVQYYTGQFFDLEAITKAGHKAGAQVGFDLAHAIGNVPLKLNKWGVDFAVWCSYKYLNSGPGNVSGIFVHEKHATDDNLPRFAGWWGHNQEERFLMKKGFIPMEGADGWQLSNVNVISSAAHLAALKLFEETGMERLRSKSIKLTNYLEFLIEEVNRANGNPIQIITPKKPKERGCQLSLFFKKNGRKVFEGLMNNGVIVDWREPNVIRMAPAPFYNSFVDVYKFFEVLKNTINE